MSVSKRTNPSRVCKRCARARGSERLEIKPPSEAVNRLRGFDPQRKPFDFCKGV